MRGAGPLDPPDLWRLAMASFLLGREDDFVRALQEAHQAHLKAGDSAAAARCAFWLGFHLANRAETARATGWFGRASRLLDEHDLDCAERGYLLLPVGHQQIMSGRYEESAATAARAAAIGRRFDDADLAAFALHLQGRALLRQARLEEGLALLDEAMVAVATGELSPQVTGLIYCSVIGACREVYALRRAQEWTRALAEWCEGQPDMVPYTGECRVYRAEILQFHGEWRESIEEARRAAERFGQGSWPDASGLAAYQRGEVSRLRGEFTAAEEAYREASRSGHEPQPGLALLRLVQGDGAAAAAATRRALAETTGRHARARLLPAHIEILLEIDEVDEARDACDELSRIAQAYGGGVLGTLEAQARGAVALKSGDAATALAPLRRAWREWQALGAPYDAARARTLLGVACRRLGDDDGARLELEAARAEFERLGAAPDLARLDALDRRDGRGGEHVLTRRQREVLALLATGRTNRAIARELFISEKTVARHVANIFNRLGVSSRAAATAYAYEHGLLDSLRT
ncbi:MAG: LuxR C-terminal-related transcriptional regulator [Longimicrobiales bacterium]